MKKKGNTKEFLLIVGALFGFVAFLHFARALSGWDMVIGSFSVPLFWSWYLFATSAFFAFVSFSLVNKVKTD